MRTLSLSDVAVLVCGLGAFGVRLSRIDVAFDDYERIIEPADVYQECKRGNVHGFRTFRSLERTTGRLLSGATCELGRRGKMGGGKQYCVYDKLLESGDEGQNCIRWELRLYGKAARLAQGVIGDTGADLEKFVRVLAELVGGQVDFIDRSSGDKNLSRCPRLSWWQRLIDKLGAVKVRIPRPVSTLEKRIHYLRRQYSPTFATIAEAYADSGGDIYELFADMLQEGAGRMGPKQRALRDQFVAARRSQQELQPEQVQ